METKSFQTEGMSIFVWLRKKLSGHTVTGINDLPLMNSDDVG